MDLTSRPWRHPNIPKANRKNENARCSGTNSTTWFENFHDHCCVRNSSSQQLLRTTSHHINPLPRTTNSPKRLTKPIPEPTHLFCAQTELGRFVVCFPRYIAASTEFYAVRFAADVGPSHALPNKETRQPKSNYPQNAARTRGNSVGAEPVLPTEKGAFVLELNNNGNPARREKAPRRRRSARGKEGGEWRPRQGGTCEISFPVSFSRFERKKNKCATARAEMVLPTGRNWSSRPDGFIRRGPREREGRLTTGTECVYDGGLHEEDTGGSFMSGQVAGPLRKRITGNDKGDGDVSSARGFGIWCQTETGRSKRWRSCKVY